MNDWQCDTNWKTGLNEPHEQGISRSFDVRDLHVALVGCQLVFTVNDSAIRFVSNDLLLFRWMRPAFRDVKVEGFSDAVNEPKRNEFWVGICWNSGEFSPLITFKHRKIVASNFHIDDVISRKSWLHCIEIRWLVKRSWAFAIEIIVCDGSTLLGDFNLPNYSRHGWWNSLKIWLS